MKKIVVAVLVIFIISQIACANDIRKKVTNENISGLKTNKIDPDKYVYGIPWEITEDDFIKNWGAPDGYFRFNAQETGMIYGKRHMFLFFNNKLSGLKITDHILDWQIAKKILPNPIFDGIQWELTNGIREETDLSRVKKILGSSLTDEMYERFYETKSAKVILNFSHYTDAGDKDEAYRVYGIMIDRK